MKHLSLKWRLYYKALRLYGWFRYDLYHFIRNMIFFHKQLWHYRGWDYIHTLAMLRRSLEAMAIEHRTRNAFESSTQTLYYINRTIRVLKLIEAGEYTEAAERSLGLKAVYNYEFKSIPNSTNVELVNNNTPEQNQINQQIYTKAAQIEEMWWEELFDNLKGDVHTYDQKLNPELRAKSYEEVHNGKGLNNWWV